MVRKTRALAIRKHARDTVDKQPLPLKRYYRRLKKQHSRR